MSSRDARFSSHTKDGRVEPGKVVTAAQRGVTGRAERHDADLHRVGMVLDHGDTVAQLREQTT